MLSSVIMLLDIIFRRLEILEHFVSCDPENKPVFSLPVQVQLNSKF